MSQNVKRYGAANTNAQPVGHDELLVQTLSHIRHDWMNDIQVLYGYLKLKKYDKMTDYVETIKQKIARESSVSRLGVPALVAYLNSFRVRCRSIRLDVELGAEAQLDKLPIDTGAVTEAVIERLESFVRHASMLPDGELNQLLLSFDVCDGKLEIGFYYSGGCHWSELQKDYELLLNEPVPSITLRESITYEENKAVLRMTVLLIG